MNYIIARWEHGGSRVYYTLNYQRFNHSTHVRKEALRFGSKISAESFLNSGVLLDIYSHPWHIVKEGK